MNVNPFIREAKEYVRTLDIVGEYVKNQTTYISTVTGDAPEKVESFVKEHIEPKSPMMRVLKKIPGGDRVKATQDLTSFLSEADHTGRFVSPSLVMYENPKKEVSFISKFAQQGMDARDILKDKMKDARANKDKEKTTFYHNAQWSKKILNNIISGAGSSPYNPIYNASTHTTLTSTCRCATSYSNATCEKFLAGNRHYYNEEITLSDMAGLIRITDLVKLEAAMTKYKLDYPTPEFLYGHIVRSVRKYWRRADDNYATVKEFIFAMSPIQRAAVAFVSDLEALYQVNPKFVATMFNTMSTPTTHEVKDPDKYVKAMNEEMVSHVGLVMKRVVNHRRIFKFKQEDPKGYAQYAGFAEHMFKALDYYGDFIRATLVTDSLPSGIYAYLFSLRDVVVVSDTDSTIFTTDDWVQRLGDGSSFSDLGVSVGATATFLFSSHLAHNLALLSRHLGVQDDKLFMLTMKGEFYQPVLGVTSMTKHYFSYTGACEGDVYEKYAFDVKGVNLKNSTHPKELTEGNAAYIRLLMDAVVEERKLSMLEIMELPMLAANKVRQSLLAGETKYLTGREVKPATAYKNPDSSVFIQKKLWDTVYGKELGLADTPPYRVVKVPLVFGPSKAKFESWLLTLPDEKQELFRKALSQAGKTSLTSIYPPHAVVNGVGVPKELVSVMDIGKYECELMTGYLSVLETIGIFIRNNKNTRLLSQELNWQTFVDNGSKQWNFMDPKLQLEAV